MKKSIRSITFLGLLLGCAGHVNTTADATRPAVLVQDYPSKPVRLIEPFGVGGGPDLLSRALAHELSELWHQPVTVENIAGPADAIADAIANMVAGDVAYRMAPISLVLPHLRDGQLTALAVTTARRSALLPEVPTISEAGVAGFDFPIWYGVWAPAGTPVGVVAKLAKDIGRVLARPDLREWVARHGGEPMTMTQTGFARFVLTESESAAQIIKAAGIKFP